MKLTTSWIEKSRTLITQIFRRLEFLILFLCAVMPVHADDLQVCRSPYALLSPNFNYNEYNKQTNGIGNYRVVFLWNTFGNKLANLSKEAAKPEVTGFEIALFNTTCVRSGKCGKYETLSGYSVNSLNHAIDANDANLRTKLQAEAQRAASAILPLLRADQKCYVNPFLEHNMNRQQYQKAIGWFIDKFNGRCEFVWNPVQGPPQNPQSPALISEGHGPGPNFGNNRCIANPDGSEIPASDYPGYLHNYGSKCEFACTWGSNDNCRTVGGGFVDPRQRPCKETGDFKKAHDAIVAARKIQPPQPPSPDDEFAKVGCKTFINIHDGAKKDFLWKQSDPPCCQRGAVVFLPTKFNKQTVQAKSVTVMKTKNVIATAYQRGVYTEDGSGRQYFRFHRLATDFPSNVVVHFGNICAVIPDPTVRND